MSITFHIEGEANADDYSNYGRHFNVSNSNAHLILTTLGYEFDYCGSLDASELIEKTVFALQTIRQMPTLDSSVETVVTKESGHATMIDCGRPEGYLEDRISKLHFMACMAKGKKVCFG